MSTSLSAMLARHAERRLTAMPLAVPVPVTELPTPALVVDRAAMERNLERMKRHLVPRGVGLRPHAKMHKCPIVAHRQLELGAVGICCAKVSEAEVMRAAGIEQILITSPVASPDKMARVVALAKRCADLRIVVDDPGAARQLGEAALAAGVRLRVVVDLDPRMGRTGVALGAPALDLVRGIVAMEGLEFTGLQQYAGQVMHIADASERRDRALTVAARGLETRDLIEADGHPVEVFTGGGTGTFDVDSEIAGITDIQAGSYVFMDEEYAALAQGNRPRFDYFEPALFVLVTAISQPRSGLITVDGGYKSFASDSVAPVPRDLADVTYHFGGDEHGILKLGADADAVRLGDVVWMVTPHCDPTVNLHDWICPVEQDGHVHELWPVSARGCSW